VYLLTQRSQTQVKLLIVLVQRKRGLPKNNK